MVLIFTLRVNFFGGRFARGSNGRRYSSFTPGEPPSPARGTASRSPLNTRGCRLRRRCWRKAPGRPVLGCRVAERLVRGDDRPAVTGRPIFGEREAHRLALLHGHGLVVVRVRDVDEGPFLERVWRPPDRRPSRAGAAAGGEERARGTRNRVTTIRRMGQTSDVAPVCTSCAAVSPQKARNNPVSCGAADLARFPGD